MDQHHRSEVKDAGQRYFNNQFAEYSNQPLTDQSQYMDQALGLMQDIYTYYTSNPSRKRRDLYTGGAGIAYACVRLLQHLPDDNQDRENIQRLCANIIDSILTEHRATLGRDKSLMNGDAGVWMAAALVYAELDRMTDAEKALKEYVGCCAGVERMTLTGSSGDELFTGRCGFLVGFLELWKRFPEHSILFEVPVAGIIRAILASGREYSNMRGFHTLSPLMFLHYEAEYVGAAHGISTILQSLLGFPTILAEIPGAINDIKATYEYLLSSQRDSGNFPNIFGAVEDETSELVQWCHGAAGVIYSLAKAYLFWKEDKYLNACKKCADILWKKGLLKKGPGLCHGISGSGYAFLLIYRITEDAEYLYRANCFADVMFQPSIRESSRLPDHPYSLYEGIAGTLCYYVDLADPMQSAFPLFDVLVECKSTLKRRVTGDNNLPSMYLTSVS